MRTLTFTDGHKITTNLSNEEVLKRMSRLDWLRVLTEGYDSGVGNSIYNKVVRAYNKSDNFTGIIRLTPNEKDFLGYMLESDMNTERDIEVINWYLRH